MSWFYLCVAGLFEIGWAIGTVLLGIYLFDEPATVAKFFCVSLILMGIVGLKLIQN